MRTASASVSAPLNFLQARIPSLLGFVAVPLAAFLAFVIQPAMGKSLQPIYGNTHGSWISCMVYFQLSLIIGYSWAAWLTRKSLRFQTIATVSLSLLASLMFHAPSHDNFAAPTLARVLWRLSLSNLPAMILLFSVSPLLHCWMRERGSEVPYHLYAISSFGSLAALLLYPFGIETTLSLTDQMGVLHAGIVLVAAIVSTISWLSWRSMKDQEHRVGSDAAEPRAVGAMLLWLWLSMLTCVAMLGATLLLSAEIGSTPLAWVAPFGIYLLSFMVAFSGRWQRWMTMASIAWLALSLSGFMLSKGFTATTVNSDRAWWLISLLASGSLVGNGVLYSLRPLQRAEQFYLVVAAGGALGGLVSVLVIPRIFSQPIEFALACAALLVTGVLWLTGQRRPTTVLLVGFTLIVPVLMLGIYQGKSEISGEAKLTRLRDFSGSLMIKTDAQSVVLSNATTVHGTQLTSDIAARRRPTLYYTENSGVGRVLERLQADRPAMTVGIIGLGAGTLSAYARADDLYDFWDIDPKAHQVARQNFTFVSDARGRINLHLADGRQALEQTASDYDLLIIDAFTGTGDGTPPYLLTREAVEIYLRRLDVRKGLLVIHASSRYSNFFPVIAATVRTLGQGALDVITDIKKPTASADWDATRTEYIIVSRAENIPAIRAWYPLVEDNGRVTRQLLQNTSSTLSLRRVWTDDRNAAVDTFELRRFLLAP